MGPLTTLIPSLNGTRRPAGRRSAGSSDPSIDLSQNPSKPMREALGTESVRSTFRRSPRVGVFTIFYRNRLDVITCRIHVSAIIISVMQRGEGGY